MWPTRSTPGICSGEIEMGCEERFQELYHREAEGLAFVPYRICPIGAHSDHNLGEITGFAIDKGIRLAYSPNFP